MTNILSLNLEVVACVMNSLLSSRSSFLEEMKNSSKIETLVL